jgi:hypothetical protein
MDGHRPAPLLIQGANNPGGREMKLWQDLRGTDTGLMSFTVIIAVFVRRKIRDDDVA